MPFVNNLQRMTYLLYRKDMHLLIKPDFIYMTSILRVKFCHIACDKAFKNLKIKKPKDSDLKTVRTK